MSAEEDVSVSGRHPYGVQPAGNAFFAPADVKPCRRPGLGKLHALKDELLLELLGYLDAPSLCAISQSSRALYVYAHTEDLWRTLVLTKYSGDFTYHAAGWKWTFATTSLAQRASAASDGAAGMPRAAALVPMHKPIVVPGFYSDLLFKAWYCAAADVQPRWLAHENIDRRSALTLTAEEFVRDFEAPNRPVIITDLVTQWPAFRLWNPTWFSTHHGQHTFDAGGFTFSLEKYFQYAAAVSDDQPLYLFDKNFCNRIPELAQHFTVPSYFASDLFQHLGSVRPDYRWLIIGPKKSGSVFHKDPNATSAWNACITGSKKWIMFPPNMPPPGVHASADGSEVATPLSVMEWMIDFYDAARRLIRQHTTDFAAAGGAGSSAGVKRARPGAAVHTHTAASAFVRMRSRKHAGAAGGGSEVDAAASLNKADDAAQRPDLYCGPMEGVVRPGELILVPRGWWHLVLNIDDSIAITQNFVSPTTLPHVLAFLRDMRYAVSGVPAADADTLYERFVAALREAEPAALDAALAKLAAVNAVASASATVGDAGCGAEGGNSMGVCAADLKVNKRWRQVMSDCHTTTASHAVVGGSESPACSSTPLAEATPAPAAGGFSFSFF